jgi:NADPH:quinone reductase-like Zn-dependent oxidoreductase
MKAAQFDHYGPPDVVHLVDIDDPGAPGPSEVLVEVKRMSINGADMKSLAGWFPDRPFPRGLGREFAGVVRKVGSDISHVSPGQAVIGEVEPAMQEYVLVDAGSVMPLPTGLTYDIGVTLPVAGQTAWAAVESQNVQPGAVCVVSGASGGVGSVITQLLLDRGATVIALAREHHHERLEVMGALPLGWSDSLVNTLREYTPQGIHHVFDQVGPQVIEAAIELGVPASQINAVSGYADLFGVRSVGRVGLDEDIITRLAKMIVDGRLVIATFTMPFVEVTKAFMSHKNSSHYGKSVLSTEDDDEALLAQIQQPM